MRRYISVFLCCFLIAVVLIPGAYSLWRKNLNITGFVQISADKHEKGHGKEPGHGNGDTNKAENTDAAEKANVAEKTDVTEKAGVVADAGDENKDEPETEKERK